MEEAGLLLKMSLVDRTWSVPVMTLVGKFSPIGFTSVAIARVGKTKEGVNEMKIGNLEFPNVEEGGLIYDPDPSYTVWLRMMGRDASKRFWVFL